MLMTYAYEKYAMQNYVYWNFWITIEYQEKYASKGHMNKEWKGFF
jgi:hypothetical protein